MRSRSCLVQGLARRETFSSERRSAAGAATMPWAGQALALRTAPLPATGRDPGPDIAQAREGSDSTCDIMSLRRA